MNTSALIWLSTLSSGLASTLGAYLFLSACLRRVNWERAQRTFRLPNVTRVRVCGYPWLMLAAPALGLVFALKASSNGGWILAFAMIAAGILLLPSLRTLIEVRKLNENTEVADLALLCMAQERHDATVLQTLEEATRTLNHSGVRRIVNETLQSFYNGATEAEALEELLVRHPNGDWALLLWSLLERRHTTNYSELRNKVDALMMRRVRLHKYTLPALELTRHSLGLALILCAALATFITLSPASSFYLGSLQGQALGTLVIFGLVWSVGISSARLRILQRICE